MQVTNHLDFLSFSYLVTSLLCGSLLSLRLCRHNLQQLVVHLPRLVSSVVVQRVNSSVLAALAMRCGLFAIQWVLPSGTLGRATTL